MICDGRKRFYLMLILKLSAEPTTLNSSSLLTLYLYSVRFKKCDSKAIGVQSITVCGSEAARKPEGNASYLNLAAIVGIIWHFSVACAIFSLIGSRLTSYHQFRWILYIFFSLKVSENDAVERIFSIIRRRFQNWESFFPNICESKS